MDATREAAKEPRSFPRQGKARQGRSPSIPPASAAGQPLPPSRVRQINHAQQQQPSRRSGSGGVGADSSSSAPLAPRCSSGAKARAAAAGGGGGEGGGGAVASPAPPTRSFPVQGRGAPGGSGFLLLLLTPPSRARAHAAALGQAATRSLSRFPAQGTEGSAPYSPHARGLRGQEELKAERKAPALALLRSDPPTGPRSHQKWGGTAEGKEGEWSERPPLIAPLRPSTPGEGTRRSLALAAAATPQLQTRTR